MTPVDRARTQLGVRWFHQGRIPGVIQDCIGLLSFSFAPWGIKDRTDYGREPHGGQLETLVEEQFGPPVTPPMRVCDVVLMSFPDKRKPPRHAGIIADYQGPGGGLSLIHTWNGGPGVVIETRLDEKWLNRIRAIHRLQLTKEN